MMEWFIWACCFFLSLWSCSMDSQRWPWPSTSFLSSISRETSFSFLHGHTLFQCGSSRFPYHSWKLLCGFPWLTMSSDLIPMLGGISKERELASVLCTWIVLLCSLIWLTTKCSCRLLKQYLLLVLVNQMASGLFRFIASVGRNMIIANTFGSLILLVVVVMSGFIMSRGIVDKWSILFSKFQDYLGSAIPNKHIETGQRK